MPRAPLYGQQQVAPNPLPAARLTAHASEATFGSDIAQGLGQLANAKLRLAFDEKQKADSAAVNAVQAQAIQRRTDDFYNPETGLMRITGPALFEASGKREADYDKYLGELRSGLANGDQQEAFDGFAMNERLEYQDRLQRRVGDERIRYERDTFTSVLDETINAAATDAANGAISMRTPGNWSMAGGGGPPERVLDDSAIERRKEFGHGRVFEYAELHADMLPIDAAEWVQQEIERFDSDLHKGVIGMLLANDQETTAMAYFGAHKDELLASDRENIQATMTVAGKNSRILNAANMAFQGAFDPEKASPAYAAAHPDEPIVTLAQMEAEAIAEMRKKLPDAADQADGIKAIHSLFETVRRGADASQRQTFQAFDAMVGEGYTPEQLKNRLDWKNLSGKQQDSLLARIAKRDKGQPVATDDLFYQDLRLAAADPETAWEFSQMDFLQERHRLSDKDYRSLLDLQTKIIGAQKGNTADGDAVAKDSFKNRIKREASARMFGEEDPDDRRVKSAEFSRVVDQYEAQEGRELTTAEYQGLVDGLSANLVFEEGWNVEGRAYAIDPNELDIEDVPTETASVIRDELRLAGMDSTDQDVILRFLEDLRLGGLDAARR